MAMLLQCYVLLENFPGIHVVVTLTRITHLNCKASKPPHGNPHPMTELPPAGYCASTQISFRNVKEYYKEHNGLIWQKLFEYETDRKVSALRGMPFQKQLCFLWTF